MIPVYTPEVGFDQLAEAVRRGATVIDVREPRRSAAMSDFLRNVGFDAYSVPGGTSEWARSGRHVAGGVG